MTFWQKVVNYFSNISYNTIDILLLISYFLFISLLLGLTTVNPYYYNIVQYIVRLYVSLYIIYKFNPYTGKKTITDGEQKIIFSSAIYLLLAIIPFEKLISIYV